MKNIIDIVYNKLAIEDGLPIEKEIIGAVLTETLNLTKDELKKGNIVFWPGLCTFTWKESKRGKKAKIEPDESIGKGLRATGFNEIKEEDKG
jgi:hypothetical protein